ncbi:hypothetical protein SNEBB_002643 [Seison nebaliae]|nr:hypothetical protein SNEBB_002643 [Seison nebaliae]
MRSVQTPNIHHLRLGMTPKRINFDINEKKYLMNSSPTCDLDDDLDSNDGSQMEHFGRSIATPLKRLRKERPGLHELRRCESKGKSFSDTLLAIDHGPMGERRQLMNPSSFGKSRMEMTEFGYKKNLETKFEYNRNPFSPESCLPIFEKMQKDRQMSCSSTNSCLSNGCFSSLKKKGRRQQQQQCSLKRRRVLMMDIDDENSLKKINSLNSIFDQEKITGKLPTISNQSMNDYEVRYCEFYKKFYNDSNDEKAKSDCGWTNNGTNVLEEMEDMEDSRMEQSTSLFDDLKLVGSNSQRFDEDFTKHQSVNHGDFGVVYSCIHRLDGVRYAVKECKLNGRAPVKDYCREICAMSWMSQDVNMSKHVVRYFSSWSSRTSNTVYIQMEYCNLGTLMDLMTYESSLELNNHFSQSTILTMILHISKGLSYLHQLKMIHRDIRPSNILLALNSKHNSHRNSLFNLIFNKYNNNNNNNKYNSSNNMTINESFLNITSSSSSPPSSTNKIPSFWNSDHQLDLSSPDHWKRCYENLNYDNDIIYKIGDFGTTQLVTLAGDCDECGDGSFIPPEFFTSTSLSFEQLYRYDVFSLGVTAYCMGLMKTTKLSDEEYFHLTNNQVKELPNYSDIFNHLLFQQLLQADVNKRISSHQLVFCVSQQLYESEMNELHYLLPFLSSRLQKLLFNNDQHDLISFASPRQPTIVTNSHKSAPPILSKSLELSYHHIEEPRRRHSLNFQSPLKVSTPKEQVSTQTTNIFHPLHIGTEHRPYPSNTNSSLSSLFISPPLSRDSFKTPKNEIRWNSFKSKCFTTSHKSQNIQIDENNKEKINNDQNEKNDNNFLPEQPLIVKYHFSRRHTDHQPTIRNAPSSAIEGRRRTSSGVSSIHETLYSDTEIT